LTRRTYPAPPLLAKDRKLTRQPFAALPKVASIDRTDRPLMRAAKHLDQIPRMSTCDLMANQAVSFHPVMTIRQSDE